MRKILGVEAPVYAFSLSKLTSGLMLFYYTMKTSLSSFFFFYDIFMISETLSEIFVRDYENKTFTYGTQP